MSQDHSHGLADHVSNPATFFKTFLALVVLMALTVASSFVQINPLVNNAINLGIAVIKASLVIMFFMGVKYATKLTKMFAVAGFIWLTLIAITFGDYATRSWEPSQGWQPGDRNDHSALESESRSKLLEERFKSKTEVQNRSDNSKPGE